MLARANAPDLRAARIAFHLNSNGSKDRILANAGCAAELDALILDAASRREGLVRMLYAVRIQHTLAVLQWYGYQNLLGKLAYAGDETEIKDADAAETA